MNLERSFIAFFKGISLCLFTPAVRRLVILPWLLGLLCYPVALYAAYHAHSPVVSYLSSSSDGFLGTIIYWVAWLLMSVLLFVGALFIAVLLVLICTAAFQTAIVEQVLREVRGGAFVELATTVSIMTILKQSIRAIGTESIKYLWLVPLFVLVFIFGFIPFFTPIAFIGAAWLLAYQFIDIVLDVACMGASKRIRYSLKNWIPVCAFGLVITLVFLIPFAGVLLAPIATAAAAWLLSEQEELWERKDSTKTPEKP